MTFSDRVLPETDARDGYGDIEMSDLKIPSELYQSMLDELKVAYQEHGDLLRDDMIEAVFKAIEENGYSIVPVEVNG